MQHAYTVPVCAPHTQTHASSYCKDACMHMPARCPHALTCTPAGKRPPPLLRRSSTKPSAPPSCMARGGSLEGETYVHARMHASCTHACTCTSQDAVRYSVPPAAMQAMQVEGMALPAGRPQTRSTRQQHTSITCAHTDAHHDMEHVYTHLNLPNGLCYR